MAGMNLAKLQMLRRNEEPRREGGDGRYARRDEPWVPEYPRRMTHMDPMDRPDMSRRDDDDDRRMGFGYDIPELYDMRRRGNGYMHYGGRESGRMEPIRFGGMVAMDGGRQNGGQRMTREMAEEWVRGMHGEDPNVPKGAKWTMDQVKPIAQKYGVPTEGERFAEFWAVMNAMYSDYYPVAKKYNALTPDFFADMAMAFINDKDAVRNKAMMYYECIVEK